MYFMRLSVNKRERVRERERETFKHRKVFVTIRNISKDHFPSSVSTLHKTHQPSQTKPIEGIVS